MKYTARMRTAGELAIRGLSKKAQAFYYNTDPFDVYEYKIWNDSEDEDDVEMEKRYAYNWMGDLHDGFTLEELGTELEELVDEIWTEEDIEKFINN